MRNWSSSNGRAPMRPPPTAGGIHTPPRNTWDQRSMTNWRSAEAASSVVKPNLLKWRPSDERACDDATDGYLGYLGRGPVVPLSSAPRLAERLAGNGARLWLAGQPYAFAGVYRSSTIPLD